MASDEISSNWRKGPFSSHFSDVGVGVGVVGTMVFLITPRKINYATLSKKFHFRQGVGGGDGRLADGYCFIYTFNANNK